jgi:hypothetical protein
MKKIGFKMITKKKIIVFIISLIMYILGRLLIDNELLSIFSDFLL